MTWDGKERRQSERDLEGLIKRAVNDVAVKAAQDAVNRTVPVVVNQILKGFGIDADDPLAVQRHMQYVRESAERSADSEVVADRAFLRQTRLRCEKVHDVLFNTGIGTVVRLAIVVALIGIAVWLGVDLSAVKALAS